MGVVCRPFELKDIDTFERIELENMPPELRFSKKRLVDIMSREDVVCYSYLLSEKVIGYFILQVDSFRRVINIIEINVDKGHQRIGIGKAALALIALIGSHLKMSQAVAQIEKKNSPLFHFLDQAGYRIEKELVDFLREGNLGLEMVKFLEPQSALALVDPKVSSEPIFQNLPAPHFEESINAPAGTEEAPAAPFVENAPEALAKADSAADSSDQKAVETKENLEKIKAEPRPVKVYIETTTSPSKAENKETSAPAIPKEVAFTKINKTHPGALRIAAIRTLDDNPKQRAPKPSR